MNNNWKNNILDIINHISNKGYQEESWFGLNKDIVDSPDEMYNTLFDDYEFEDFIITYDNELSYNQKKLALELITLMNNINDIYYKHLIDSTEWNKVRQTARLFYNTFNHKVCPTKNK